MGLAAFAKTRLFPMPPRFGKRSYPKTLFDKAIAHRTIHDVVEAIRCYCTDSSPPRKQMYDWVHMLAIQACIMN